MKKILVFFIRVYQLTFSSILGRECRFYPTCSDYAKEAIEKFGIRKGLRLAIKRLSKCHPWSKKDPIDPVPESTDKEGF